MIGDAAGLMILVKEGESQGNMQHKEGKEKYFGKAAEEAQGMKMRAVSQKGVPAPEYGTVAGGMKKKKASEQKAAQRHEIFFSE